MGGAGRVFATDVSQYRLDWAMKSGATAVFNGTLVLNEPIEWPEKAEEISLSVAQGWAILNSLPKADDL